MASRITTLPNKETTKKGASYSRSSGSETDEKPVNKQQKEEYRKETFKNAAKKQEPSSSSSSSDSDSEDEKLAKKAATSAKKKEEPKAATLAKKETSKKAAKKEESSFSSESSDSEDEKPAKKASSNFNGQSKTMPATSSGKNHPEQLPSFAPQLCVNSILLLQEPLLRSVLKERITTSGLHYNTSTGRFIDPSKYPYSTRTLSGTLKEKKWNGEDKLAEAMTKQFPLTSRVPYLYISRADNNNNQKITPEMQQGIEFDNKVTDMAAVLGALCPEKEWKFGLDNLTQARVLEVISNTWGHIVATQYPLISDLVRKLDKKFNVPTQPIFGVIDLIVVDREAAKSYSEQMNQQLAAIPLFACVIDIKYRSRPDYQTYKQDIVQVLLYSYMLMENNPSLVVKKAVLFNVYKEEGIMKAKSVELEVPPIERFMKYSDIVGFKLDITNFGESRKQFNVKFPNV